MTRTPLKSTWLAAAGYDAETKTLEVEFKNGSVFQYPEVPAEVAEKLLTAKSPGAYFGQCVRGCGFEVEG